MNIKLIIQLVVVLAAVYLAAKLAWFLTPLVLICAGAYWFITNKNKP